MNWYKKAQNQQNDKNGVNIPGYPYYLAISREGRLKGQAPMNIKFVPSLVREWDRGGFGTGTKATEFKGYSAQEVLNQLKMRHINPAFDAVDFYIVRRPNSSRERLQYAMILDMARSD